MSDDDEGGSCNVCGGPLRYGERHRKCGEAVMAAEAAERGRQTWRPIEAAPKDGTVFLGWVAAQRWTALDGEFSSANHDTSQVDFCWWRNPPADMQEGGYFDNGAGQIGDAQEVTHWMPLPESPIRAT
jgi:hypothetical protein